METKNNLSQHFRISGPHQEKTMPRPQEFYRNGTVPPSTGSANEIQDLTIHVQAEYHCFYKCSGVFFFKYTQDNYNSNKMEEKTLVDIYLEYLFQKVKKK